MLCTKIRLSADRTDSKQLLKVKTELDLRYVTGINCFWNCTLRVINVFSRGICSYSMFTHTC